MRENLNKKTTSEKERACPADIGTAGTVKEKAVKETIVADRAVSVEKVAAPAVPKTAETGEKANQKLSDAIEEEANQKLSDAVEEEANQKLSDAVEEERIALDEAAKVESCAGRRHKKRTPEEQKALVTRLKRVEGQIRGIERMVENDAYCPDILIQVSAATSALNSFNKELLQCHVRGCVAPDIRDGKDETIDELCRILQKLMK